MLSQCEKGNYKSHILRLLQHKGYLIDTPPYEALSARTVMQKPHLATTHLKKPPCQSGHDMKYSVYFKSIIYKRYNKFLYCSICNCSIS